jgi:hypothetical protein
MRGVKSIGTKKLGGIFVAHPNCTVVLPTSIYWIAASASSSPAVSMTSSLIYSSSAFCLLIGITYIIGIHAKLDFVCLRNTGLGENH